MHRCGRFLLLVLILLLLVGVGGAITTYNITVDGDTAYMNVTFELYSSLGEDGEPRKINYWETTWSTPPNTEIRSISDSQGELTEYSFNGETLRFKTNSGPRRSKEVINLQLAVNDVIEERYNGLDLVRLRLSGFPDRRDDVPDEQTQVTVETTNRLLSESHSYGFNHTLDRHSATYKGDGPLNLHLALGDGDAEYDNYVLFGEGNLTGADELYWLVPAITGMGVTAPRPAMNKHPVIVLPDEQYDENVDTWSSGQYRTGGLIFLRASTAENEDLPAILLHEVMHAYNEHALEWTNEGLGWFDEGTAKYVEYLVKHEKNLRYAELFGEDVTWTGPCEDSAGRCRYTLSPRGTPDQLWNYYRQESDFMYTWTPSGSATTEERRFGYAFSELLIRNYIRNNGGDSLHPVYTDLVSMQRDPDASVMVETEQVLDSLDADFTPCYDPDAASRQDFESCLDTVNDMEPPVPETVTVDDTTHHITIDPIERPTVSDTVVEHIRKQTASETSMSWKEFFIDLTYLIGHEITGFFTNLFKKG